MRFVLFLLLAMISQAARAVDYTGTWYDPQYPAQGLSITQDGNVVFLVFYTYDKAGNALWLYSTLDFTPKLAGFDTKSGYWHRSKADPTGTKSFPGYTAYEIPDLERFYGTYSFPFIGTPDDNHLLCNMKIGATVNPLDPTNYTTFHFVRLNIGTKNVAGSYKGSALKTTFAWNGQYVAPTYFNSPVDVKVEQTKSAISFTFGDCTLAAAITTTLTYTSTLTSTRLVCGGQDLRAYSSSKLLINDGMVSITANYSNDLSDFPNVMTVVGVR